jgi:glycosyltransferase involved in cell wall biosynthesis
MLRIIISCKTLLKGGAEKQTLILSKLLTENRIYVILINWSGTKVDPEYLKYIDDHSIKYLALEGNLVKKFFNFIQIIKDEKISVIFSYLTLSNFLSGLTKFFLKDVVTIGGIRNEKLPYHKFLFEKWVHNFLNDATVFNNFSAGKKFIHRGFKSEKIFVIHNAIENPQKIIRTKKLDSDLRILTVSRFVEQKDFRTALYSFKSLVDRNKEKNLIYHIVGFGPLENEIRSLAEHLNVVDRVKVFINPSDIPEIMKQCDIYLSTSLFEGLSNSLMEAMVFGLPIVATDVGDNSYLIEDGLNGFLVGCKDIDSIAEKLNILIGSEELRNRFGEFSQDKIMRDFSMDRMQSGYLTLLSNFFKL